MEFGSFRSYVIMTLVLALPAILIFSLLEANRSAYQSQVAAIVGYVETGTGNDLELTAEQQVQLAQSSDWRERLMVARYPTTYDAILPLLKDDSNSDVIIALCKGVSERDALSTEVQRELATSSKQRVRLELARHSGADVDVLISLTGDVSHAVQAAARDNLTAKLQQK